MEQASFATPNTMEPNKPNTMKVVRVRIIKNSYNL